MKEFFQDFKDEFILNFVDGNMWKWLVDGLKNTLIISVLKIDSNYLKLISALIVAVFLAVPYWKSQHIHGKAGKEKHHA